MVDKTVLAARTAAIRDAVERIRTVLPPSVETFLGDRTAREIVTLNLFRALQDAISLATHWLADEGWDIPQTLGDAFQSLAEHGVIEADLASRLRAGAGLRNLIAHQYGVVDFRRLFDIASRDLDQLLRFCQELAGRIASDDEPECVREVALLRITIPATRMAAGAPGYRRRPSRDASRAGARAR